MADIWRRINEDTALSASVRPLMIAGGYTQAQLVADRAGAAAAVLELGAGGANKRQPAFADRGTAFGKICARYSIVCRSL